MKQNVLPGAPGPKQSFLERNLSAEVTPAYPCGMLPFALLYITLNHFSKFLEEPSKI